MKKIILLVDLILIAGTLALVGFGSLQLTGNPVLEFPENGIKTTGTVLFSFENADYILIDDNTQFSSARKIDENNFVLRLEPGTYYWKAVGKSESEIRYFTILSKISLEIKKSSEGYDVFNAGNTALDVEFYDDGELVKKNSFAPGESEDVEGDLIIGGENE